MTEGTYIGAVDQGTTGTRFMVFDHGGQVVTNAYRKHEQIYPEPGWVEHDPEEIWDNTQAVMHDALEEAGGDAEQLEAIGITNQRETTPHLGPRDGQAIANAIVWTGPT
ncbi:FGGY family carbohydrate kinase, partial [Halogeometricum sp. CBA1124]|uniref:FGGY family carbohydrate kinase n=1 Tax=Halogeometricum sp. CBA1124 TaxID=2668071 RepID=UPI00142BABC4